VPIYDYVCSSCSTRTEFIHGIDAPTPRFCPTCGAEATLRKVVVAPTVHFKGSGWAKKDRSSASRSKTKAAAASGSGEGSSSPSESSGPSRTSSDDGTSGGSDPDSSKKPTDSGAGKSAPTSASSEG
jgi:putative FmdB family regulatory protein